MKKLLWLVLLILSQQALAKKLIDEDPNGDKHYILEIKKTDDGKIYVLEETVFSEPNTINGSIASSYKQDMYFNCKNQHEEISFKYINKSGKIVESYAQPYYERSWTTIYNDSIAQKIQNYVCSR